MERSVAILNDLSAIIIMIPQNLIVTLHLQVLLSD